MRLQDLCYFIYPRPVTVESTIEQEFKKTLKSKRKLHKNNECKHNKQLR